MKVPSFRPKSAFRNPSVGDNWTHKVSVGQTKAPSGTRPAGSTPSQRKAYSKPADLSKPNRAERIGKIAAKLQTFSKVKNPKRSPLSQGEITQKNRLTVAHQKFSGTHNPMMASDRLLNKKARAKDPVNTRISFKDLKENINAAQSRLR